MTKIKKFFKSQGFEVLWTGGNCRAWMKGKPALKGHLLVTSRDGMCLPEEEDEIIIVGFYDESSEPIGFMEMTMKEFMEKFSSNGEGDEGR